MQPAEPARAEEPPAAALTAPVRAYIDAARVRERSARRLSGRREWVGALVLYSQAIALLARAHLLAGGAPQPLSEQPAQLLGTLLELARREGWLIPIELERLHPLLCAAEWDALDRLDELAAERASDDLAVALRFLLGKFPELERAERQRELRWFAAGSALLVLSGLGVLLWSLTRPPNLALKRPVSASPAGYATAADEAVNGVRFGEIGYHSQAGPAWLQVDLEVEREVRRVELYGRGDCCLDKSLPLVIEGSSDGQSYDVLAKWNEPFELFRPAVLRLEPTRLRYLRLRTLRKAFLMIAEVEVY